jgi:hypothetical protein
VDLLHNSTSLQYVSTWHEAKCQKNVQYGSKRGIRNFELVSRLA